MTTYRINKDLNGIEIMFDSKPAVATLDALKAAGFRWHRINKLWYAKNTADRLSLAQSLAEGQEAPKAAKVTAKLEQINMEGVGPKKKPAHGAEFAKIIREELKVRGVKGVTVRSQRGGWTDSFTITISATEADFASIEEAAQRYTLSEFGCDIQCRGIYTGGRYLYYNEWESMTDAQQEEAHKIYLFESIGKMCSINHYILKDRKYYWELTTGFYNRLNDIFAIVNQWNWDRSDLMSDYYDVGYYLDFDIKKPEGFSPREEMTEEERTEYAEEVQKAEEEFQKQLAALEAKRQEEAAASAKYEAWRQEARQNIENNLTVKDLDESEQFFARDLLAGAGKESTLEELKEYATTRQDALITRAVTLTESAFDDFCKLFLDDFGFLDGFGGTASEDVRLEDNNTYNKLTAEQRETIKFFANNCVAVYVGNDLRLVIDPEGFSYARYVFIVDDMTTTETGTTALEALKAESESKPAFYIPAPIAEQVSSISEGDEVTVYQCDGWILNNIESARGVVTAVYEGKYAQYNGVYLELANRGKINRVFLRDHHEALIYKGIKSKLPESITRRHIKENMYELLNYNELFPAVLAYYATQGERPIVDTIAR